MSIEILLLRKVFQIKQVSIKILLLRNVFILLNENLSETKTNTLTF